MYRLLLLLVAFVARSNALYGGKEIGIELAPHQVSVWERLHPKCGGSIVSEEWILSLSSCVDAFVDNFKVVAGSKYTDGRGGSEHRVVEAVHHMFASGGKVDPSRELVLLRVSPAIRFDANRRAVKLVDADYKLVPGQRLIFSGYGYTNGFVESPILRSGTASSILLEDCVKAYEERFGSLYPGLACSDGSSAGTSGCVGDSGSPVVLEDGRLVAVSTSRYSCGKPSEQPDILALVAKVRSWIKIVASV